MALTRYNWDPRILLKFMGIRAFSASVKDKGVSGNTLGLDKGRTLRDSIDAYLPSFYLVDIETIVDETFRELDILTNRRFFSTVLNKRLQIKETQKRASLPVINPFSKDYISQTESTNTKNINEISPEAFDIYKNWFFDRWSNRQSLINSIHQELLGYEGNKKSFKTLMTSLENFRDSIANRTGNSKPITDSELRAKIDSLIANKLTGTFGKIDQEEVSQLISGYDINKNHLYYGPSFNLVSSNIYQKIDKVFFEFFNSRPFEIELIKPQFKVGLFVAGGHSGYRQKGSPLYGVTPMTITGSLILETFGTKDSTNVPAQEDLAGYTRDFFTRTLHRDYIIEFNLNTNYDLGVLWELGISFVRSQRFSFNSNELSRDEQLEMSLLIKEYDKLSKKLEKEIVKGIFSGNKLFDLIFRQFTRSPTLEEVIVSKVIAPLTGGKTKFGKKSSKDAIPVEELIKLPKQNKRSGTVPTSKSVVKKAKKPSVPKTGPKFKPTQRDIKPISSSALNLESLINAQLHDRIKANMGTGNRRDVLNYRTGRFAQSVKVERLSESRQGMITAFYSYMKNPYATFTQGGRQEFPRSRDPKLLISKSIREIAATLVGNRMRAVSL